MEKLETIEVIVKNGVATLNLPDLVDGTKIKLQIISYIKPLKIQVSDLNNGNSQEVIEQEIDYNTNNTSTDTSTDTSTNTSTDTSTDTSNLNVSDEELSTAKEEGINRVKDNKTGTITVDNKLFDDLGLIEPLLEAIEEQGYQHPTPIQVKAIPKVLEGEHILATAKTGSGKTAAFSLPIIQLLSEKKVRGKLSPRALVLAPTRELAIQIGESFTDYSFFTDVNHVTIYGGVSQKPQVRKLQKGRDIIVATPGRLLDLINQRHINTEKIEILVLDEADRMLDMGFIHDIRKLMKMIPDSCQKMLFSATMPKPIVELADQILVNPVQVSVDPPTSAVETIDSRVFFVEKKRKLDLLLHLINTENINRALVFMRTKHSANKVVKKLKNEGIRAEAIHGNKSQNTRERVLADFKQGRFRILVATDIAARGIDIDDITHVINYDMSNEAETYIHRIGRTARAGKSGIAYNFCDEKEREYLIDIERLIQEHLVRVEKYPFKSKLPTAPTTNLDKKSSSRSKPRYKRSGSTRRSSKPKRKFGEKKVYSKRSKPRTNRK